MHHSTHALISVGSSHMAPCVLPANDRVLPIQVNQNLRSFGGLSRNDVQCMLYQHPDGLPDTIRSGLNNKVDQLLKVGVASVSST